MKHIKLTKNMHNRLLSHLHCGDGLEAVSFAICGHTTNCILVHDIFNIPYSQTNRSENRVEWATKDVEFLLNKCRNENFCLIKFHSHFVEGSNFSDFDDVSDSSFFGTVFAWNEKISHHASIIMYESGKMKGRTINQDLKFSNVDKFSIIGEDIQIQNLSNDMLISDSLIRNLQTLGVGTTKQLQKLKIGVLGCSGTGSPVIEQLVRLGVGQLILVDPDTMGFENMNRIYGSSIMDAEEECYKVDVLKRHIDNIGLKTKVTTFKTKVQCDLDTWNELTDCDFVFGCVDSVEGRYYLDLLSKTYLIPIIDIGVHVTADEYNGIDSIVGNIHYVTPESSTLLERGVYNVDELDAEMLKRRSPKEFKNRSSYIVNIEESSPAIISVNSIYASLAVTEFLSRISSFRNCSNKNYSSTVVNLTEFNLNSTKVDICRNDLFKSKIGLGNLAKTEFD